MQTPKAMNPKMALVLLTSAMLISTACGKKPIDDKVSSMGSVDPVEASIESGMTMVSGMADDQAGSSYAQMSSASGKASIWEVMLGVSKAWAESCARAYWQTCNNGLKAVTYHGCSVNGTARTLSGSVQLSYSHMSCSLTNNGDSVTRTYDLDIAGPRGGVISHQSAVASDYRGANYGGGGRLTKTNAGWDLEILGRHTQLSFRDHEIFNISVRTLAPLQVSGALSRSGRMISSGQLEVNHNLSGFTSVLTPANLQWTASCCHPTSGSLSIVYSGAKSGSATVTFQGCGAATVDEGGQSKQIELSYCD